MAAGGITVPAYTTHTVEDHRYVLANCGARAVIVSTARWRSACCRRRPGAERRPRRSLIEPPERRPRLACRAALLAFRAGAGPSRAGRGRRTGSARSARDDVACLIYTSGTGGMPKGVMTTPRQPPRQLLRRLSRCLKTDRPRRRGVPVLPAAVAFLRAHGGHDVPDLARRRRSISPKGAETLAANLPEARPTIMTAVPRLYETLHQRILRAVEREGGLRRKAVLPRRWRSAASATTIAGSLTLVERVADRDARSAGARQGARALRRPAQGDGLGRRAAQSRDRHGSSSRWACGCCRATARPRPRR